MIILDASAVLALLQDETGADEVEVAIEQGAVISAVNLSEVLTKVVDAGTSADDAADLIVSLFVEIVPFGLGSARDSARIRTDAPDTGLSFGDRACLSLARVEGAAAITADQAWLESAGTLGIDVRSIR